MKIVVPLLALLVVMAVAYFFAAPALRARRDQAASYRRSDVREAEASRARAWAVTDTYRDGIENVRRIVNGFEDAWPDAAALVRHELREIERQVAALPPARPDHHG